VLFRSPVRRQRRREGVVRHPLLPRADALQPHAGQAELDLDLGDTIGVAKPRDIWTLLEAFDASARSRMTLHLHDTFHRATDCVRTALDMGVRSFDGSAGGLGGCPYASTKEKRAPGNISTEALVRAAHDAGYETGVDLDALAAAGEFARKIVARAAP